MSDDSGCPTKTGDNNKIAVIFIQLERFRWSSTYLVAIKETAQIKLTLQIPKWI